MNDQVAKIHGRFGIDRVAPVGDRGMLTTVHIREDTEPVGLHWISALKLKTTDIHKLLKEGVDGAPALLRLRKLVPDEVAEITGPDFPGKRLLVCSIRACARSGRASARTCWRRPRRRCARSRARRSGQGRG